MDKKPLEDFVDHLRTKHGEQTWAPRYQSLNKEDKIENGACFIPCSFPGIGYPGFWLAWLCFPDTKGVIKPPIFSARTKWQMLRRGLATNAEGMLAFSAQRETVTMSYTIMANLPKGRDAKLPV